MPFTLIGAFGVRVLEVDELGPDAHYLASLKLLLVDAALDEIARHRISDKVLPLLFTDPVAGPDLRETG